MNKKFLDLIQCPIDNSNLDLINAKTINNVIESGELACKKCDNSYQIINGIPHFTKDEGYVKNFGFQWEKHARTQIDIEKNYNEKTFFETTGFKKNEIKGKLFLDVGCGKGRYSIIAKKYGGIVVGIDMSNAVFQAKKNFNDDLNSIFIRTDINELPFKSETFDYIFSIGVLHHTPDPEKSFKALINYLKKDASISISVYNQGALLYEWSKRIRKYTTRMSKRSLYNMCSIACRILYPIYKIPVLKLLIYYLDR